jgi:hypothetical protein
MGGLSGSGRIRCRASHVTGAMREPPGREDSSLWHDRILTLFRKGGAGRTRERRGGFDRCGRIRCRGSHVTGAMCEPPGERKAHYGMTGYSLYSGRGAQGGRGKDAGDYTDAGRVTGLRA